MSDLTLPPDYAPTISEATKREIDIVKLAREIAMNFRPLEKILETHLIDQKAFEVLKRTPYFDRVLKSEIEAWETAVNTGERVKLKSAAMMEEYLPELWKRMVQPKEDLMKIVKGAELLTKLAGLNAEREQPGNASDRVVITINMGAERLHVAKGLPPKVIDVTPNVGDPADELQQNLFEMSLDGNQS